MTGTEVTLSEGLTYIGARAFGYSTCKTIGDSCFCDPP